MNISIKKQSGVYILESHQRVNASLDKVWDFFTVPENLNAITPSNINFKITSTNLQKIYSGQIIAYSIKIFPFIANNWITEITFIKDKEFFIDEQRVGPYAMWHHEHHFKEIDNGVEMTDRVVFKLPMGVIGNFIAGKWVKNKVKSIFEHRFKVIENLF